MKSFTLIMLTVLALTLAACGGSTSTAPTAPQVTTNDATPTPLSATYLKTDYADATSVRNQLALGTLKLEGTANAITAEQAKSLLPLWQAIVALSGTTTTAEAELTAVQNQIVTALTPAQTLPGYSKATLTAELTHGDIRAHEAPTTQSLPVSIPEDGNSGVGGLLWLLVAMIPASIGGGILQPSINSLITKRIEPSEIGGTLGISSALQSAANAVAPVIGGTLFQAGGSSLPFWVWAIIMGGLLGLAYSLIKPGREEQTARGLARGGAH